MELMPARIREIVPFLANTEGDPICAYVYDLDALAKHVGRLRRRLPAMCQLFYAVKANAEWPIVRTLAGHVDGFEVSSGGELDWIRSHFPDVPIAFGGPGKTDSELALALDSGVELLHVESAGELHRLAHLARTRSRRAAILLRINLPLPELATTTLTMGGTPSQFGIDAAQLPGLLEWLQQHPELELHGFHFHLLSHQLDAAAHVGLIRIYLETVARWQREFQLDIRQINVGGGVGIHYRNTSAQFDWDTFTDGLGELTRAYAGVTPCLRFELGRYVTAACGYYVMEVLDLKECFGETFAVARGGTHHFRTPQAQGHSHPFSIVPVERWPYPFARPEIAERKVTIAGQLCTPKDVLARNVHVARLRAGDRIVFPLAGAYAWNISHHEFLRHPPPTVVYLPHRGPPC